MRKITIAPQIATLHSMLPIMINLKMNKILLTITISRSSSRFKQLISMTVKLIKVYRVNSWSPKKQVL